MGDFLVLDKKTRFQNNKSQVYIFKTMVSLFLVVCLLLSGFPYVAKAEEISVSAKSAVLMCSGTSQLIYEKNSKQQLPMASTTKIMTALLTLEEAEKDNKEITITDKMLPVEGSTMGLRVGYKLTLYALAQGMLLISGNDAAHCAAISISGSIEEFAKRMNSKAKEIGMNDTNFVTPSGLDDDNHYSTAYDMALLASYAMNNESFKKIASSKSMNVEYIEPKKTCEYRNSNRLLRSYDGCKGVKTGFTKKSGRCLVSFAERENKNLVCVTLNDPNDWKDHTELLNYGFANSDIVELGKLKENYEVEVVGSDKDIVDVAAASTCPITVTADKKLDNVESIVNLPKFVYAPVKAGQKLGWVEYKKAGNTIATIDLLASSDAEYIKQDLKKSENKFIMFLRKTFKGE